MGYFSHVALSLKKELTRRRVEARIPFFFFKENLDRWAMIFKYENWKCLFGGSRGGVRVSLLLTSRQQCCSPCIGTPAVSTNPTIKSVIHSASLYSNHAEQLERWNFKAELSLIHLEKSFNVYHLELVRVWPDQSASTEGKEAGAMVRVYWVLPVNPGLPGFFLVACEQRCGQTTDNVLYFPSQATISLYL